MQTTQPVWGWLTLFGLLTVLTGCGATTPGTLSVAALSAAPTGDAAWKIVMLNSEGSTHRMEWAQMDAQGKLSDVTEIWSDDEEPREPPRLHETANGTVLIAAFEPPRVVAILFDQQGYPRERWEYVLSASEQDCSPVELDGWGASWQKEKAVVLVACQCKSRYSMSTGKLIRFGFDAQGRRRGRINPNPFNPEDPHFQPAWEKNWPDGGDYSYRRDRRAPWTGPAKFRIAVGRRDGPIDLGYAKEGEVTSGLPPVESSHW